MRTISISAALLALAAASCFGPSMGDRPFFCTPPAEGTPGSGCPEGYVCAPCLDTPCRDNQNVPRPGETHLCLRQELQCSAESRQCPEGYECHATSLGSQCVRREPDASVPDAPLPDGGDGAERCFDPTAACPDHDIEPNDSFDRASEISVGRRVNFAVCAPGDVDYYSFLVAPGKVIRVIVELPCPRAEGELEAVLYDPQRVPAVLESAPCAEPPAGTDDGECIEHQAPGGDAAQRWYVAVKARTSGAVNRYNLDLQIVDP